MNLTLRRMAAALAAVCVVQVRGQQFPASPAGVTSHRNLAYVEGGHERQALDLHVPSAGEGPFPVIVWVHGGGWQNGSKEGCPPLRNGYVGRGYAVASLNYRLSGHAVFPAQIEDCKAAVRWLRAHAAQYRLDAGRIGAWGSSAGGHLVALLGTSGDVKEFDVGPNLDRSSRVQAVCDYYGPSDFASFVAEPGFERHATAESPEAKLLGGTVKDVPEKARRASPVTYVTPDDPPFLIVHGDRDGTVPIRQSQLLFEALKKAGVGVHFHTIRGAGHGQGFGGPEVEPMVAAFFDRALKGTAAAAKGEAKTSESEASAAPQGARPAAGAPSDAPRGRGISFERVIGRADRNSDGRLSRDEFPGPRPLFDRMDRDRDGFVTREEHDAAFPPRPAEPRARDPASPPAATPGAWKLDGERWTCATGDGDVSGVLVKPGGKGPFPALLISHGLGGSAETFGLQKAREFVKMGFVCIAPDYTHNARAAGAVRGRAGPGGGAGAPAGAGAASRTDFGASAENLRRARLCVDRLRAMPDVDPKRIAAYGHSMGGFVTIGLAASATNLLAAAAITGSGVAPTDGHPAPSAGAAERIRTPFLMLHGGEDPVVRPAQSEALKEILDRNRVPNERRVLSDEGHNIDRTRQGEVFDAIRGWFTRHGVLDAAR